MCIADVSSQSSTMVQVERRSTALPIGAGHSCAPKSAKSTSKVFKQSDLPKYVFKRWEVYQHTLIAYVGSLQDVRNPFDIPNSAAIFKEIFDVIYPEQKDTGEYKIQPKEVIYDLVRIFFAANVSLIVTTI